MRRILFQHRDQGMYRATIAAIRELVPDLRVAGLTATPYRLDGGHLCEGEGHIFDSVVYEYSIAQGIREGFLSPLSSKATKTLIDVSGVGKRSGEFIAEQLEAVASEIDVVNGACDEIVSACRQPDAPGWSSVSVSSMPSWCATHCVRAASMPRWCWARPTTMSAIASSRIFAPGD